MNKVTLRTALAATLLALAFPASGFAQAVTLDGSSGDSSAGATAGCIDGAATSEDTSGGATAGSCPSGGGDAANVGASSGDTIAAGSVACIDGGASGSTSGNAGVGSCSSGSSAESGAGAAGVGVSDGDTTAGTGVGCVDASGGSTDTSGGGSVGSCTTAAAAGAARAGLTSGDTTAGGEVACIDGSGAGDAAASASIGSCAAREGGSAPAPGDENPPGDVGGAAGEQAQGGSGPLGTLAGVARGNLPLTGLPVWLVFLAGINGLALGAALYRRRSAAADLAAH